MSELFLIRHGIAEDPRPGQSDAARALTEDGRRRLEEVAQGLASLGIAFDELVHSPLLRAVESAEVLAPLAVGGTRVEVALAEPPGPALLARLCAPRTALVGHEPFLGQWLDLLLLGRQSAHPWAFKKAGVAWLEGEPTPGGMRLIALLPPRVTRRIH